MIPYCILVIEDDSDRAFMENLYLEYQRLIYSEVGKIVRNNWDTEDVFQNVLVNLISQIAKLRSLPRDELVRYIITTAKHTAYDYFRSRKGDNDLSYDDYIETADEGSQEDGLESRLISAEELEHLISIPCLFWAFSPSSLARTAPYEWYAAPPLPLPPYILRA